MEARRVSPHTFAVIVIIFGIWGDLMLRTLPLGLNVPLWTLPLLLVIPIAYGRAMHQIAVSTWVFIGIAGVFSLVPLMRDSISLNVICLWASLGALLIAAAKQTGLLLWAAGVFQYVLHLVSMVFDATITWTTRIGFGDMWSATRVVRSNQAVPALFRGILISIPIIIFFALLFSSADARYEQSLNAIFEIDPTLIVGHTFYTILFAWLAAALLFMFFFPEMHESGSGLDTDFTTKWSIELFVVLLSTNAMFLSYVIVQLGYLFGGFEHMVAVDDMTVAQYARRGFFEAATAAALAIAMLLIVDELRAKSSPAQNGVFKGLGVSLVGLSCAVVASGVQRIVVYRHVFGLTEDRFYVFGILVWMIGVLIWLAISILRGRPRGFVVGSVVWGYACLFAVVCINPHGYIARVNLERAADGADLDAPYLATLSADAAPVLHTALPSLTDVQQEIIRRGISRDMGQDNLGDVRSWCYARVQRAMLFDDLEIEVAGEGEPLASVRSRMLTRLL